MTDQITIIGLGQIGASMGLALKSRGLDARLVGHDKKAETAKEAQKRGAVDALSFNLPASVRDARVVILALPFAAVRETLEIIAPDLQEGTLVVDTAPAKARVTAWAKELLPAGRYYVGLSPAINPQYLHEIEFGVRAARADLFENGIVVVDVPSGTPEAAFNLAMSLVRLLGAQPLLMDAVEADGIFTTMHLLPQLTSAALLDATLNKPGWMEARKLGGRSYASVSSGLVYQDDVDSLRDAALENRDSMVRLLNSVITSLVQLRDEIDANDRESLGTRLENAQRGRNRWFDERLLAEWLDKDPPQSDVPSFGDQVSHMLFGDLFRDRSKQKK